MCWKRVALMLSAVALCLSASSGALAQGEVRVLIYQEGLRTPAWFAAGTLGYRRDIVKTEGAFILAMQTVWWDLVVLEMPHDEFTQKELVAQLLEDYMAAGGRMLVNFNHLDEWPRLQRLLQVADAVDRPIREDVVQTDPPHPSYPFSHAGWFFPWISDPWADRGDYLTPSGAGTTAAVFEGGRGAVVIANDRHSIVNGFDWDSYPGGASGVLAEFQMAYLMRCPADFDSSSGPGVLDIFDFLEFQAMFVAKDYRANMAFDPFLDIFDFLAFQDAFVRGCV